MARMARFMKSELHAKLDDAINGGAVAVFVVAILAVGREGLETALYLWVGAQAAQTTSAAPLLGAVLGLATVVRHRLGDLPRRPEAQPARVLRLDRRCS